MLFYFAANLENPLKKHKFKASYENKKNEKIENGFRNSKNLNKFLKIFTSSKQALKIKKKHTLKFQI